MRRYLRSILALVLFPMAGTGTAHAVEVGLRGSPESMVRQHAIAKENDYTFVKTAADIAELVDRGELVPVQGNANYWVKTQRHRYALPEVRLLIERLAAQYHEATGEQLVVTSLTRPTSEQPSNSHPLSVHPAGMAVDLRVPQDAASRRWLENSLLSLERAGMLDVTRERFPPHYHVAVFPRAYAEYVEERLATEAAATREAEAESALKPFAAIQRFEASHGEDERSESRSTAASILFILSGAAFWHRTRRRNRHGRDGLGTGHAGNAESDG